MTPEQFAIYRRMRGFADMDHVALGMSMSGRLNASDEEGPLFDTPYLLDQDIAFWMRFLEDDYRFTLA